MEVLITHLWKSAVITTIFYGFYRLALQRETFFQSIRYFLIFGILASLVIPFIFVPKYVTIQPTYTFLVETTPHSTLPDDSSLPWLSVMAIIYVSVAAILLFKFIVQLGAIGILIFRSNYLKFGTYYIIETDSEISPFSFFNFIIYNPMHFEKDELKQIIAHEKVHAIQKHSIDTLLSHMLVVFQWFNPFAWSYKNTIAQNLEFIADEHAQKIAISQSAYQQLLLKTTIPNYHIALANNFYNSLLKKRIIMLHKQRSNSRSQWKLVAITPLLLAFIFAFNVKTIAQQNSSKKKIETVQVEIFAKIIDKSTSKNALNETVNTFADKGLTVKFSGVKRNKDNEIIAIKIHAKTSDGKKSTSYSINDDESIQPIQLSFNEKNKAINIGTIEGQHAHNYRFSSTGKGDGIMVISNDDDTNTWVTEKGHKKIIVEIDEDTEHHEDHENQDHEETVIIDADGKEIKKEIIKIKKGGDNKFIFISGDQDDSPLIFLNGKEISKKQMEALDTDSIKSVNVIKGKKAVEKYGEKAEDGVIEITTKTKE